jgi:hypothetical protein
MTATTHNRSPRTGNRHRGVRCRNVRITACQLFATAGPAGGAVRLARSQPIVGAVPRHQPDQLRRSRPEYAAGQPYHQAPQRAHREHRPHRQGRTGCHRLTENVLLDLEPSLRRAV